MKTVFFKDSKGEVIRAFQCFSEKIYLIYKKSLGRLDFYSSFDSSNTDLLLLDQIEVSKLTKKKYLTISSGYLELDDAHSVFLRSPPVSSLSENSNHLLKIFIFVFLLYILFSIGLYSFSRIHEKEDKEDKTQRVVNIIKPPPVIKIKKMVLGNRQNFLQKSSTSSVKKKIIKKSLKKMGALSAFGSLSKKDSKQKGGINLGASRVSSGPGFEAQNSHSGSGGVQDSLYSKGMITAALGSGGNIKGGGGYGTKGTQKGGGSSGYGELTLVGSSGTEDLFSSSHLDSSGGAFDFSLIEKEIIKNIGGIRLCYDRSLKMDPSLKGIFTVSFSINTQGQVIFSKRHPSSEINSQHLVSCILSVINKIRFPVRLTSVASFDYSFDLNALEIEGGS